MGPILVFGHRHPDNDSVCSAVAYAHLKNQTDPDNVYIPARLGPAPTETAWLFDRFGIELPAEIAHTHTRVRDVMTADVVSVTPEHSMLEAGRLMRVHDIRALPVTAHDGHLLGLLSQRMLAERYLDETEIADFRDTPTSIERLVRVLDGELMAGDPAARVGGGVVIGAAEPETLVGYIEPGDVVIMGDRVRAQPMVLEAGVACLIVTTGSRPPADVIALAEKTGAGLILTKHDTYSVARLVSLSQAVGDVMDTDMLTVGPETLLTEAAEDLLASMYREAVVIDDAGAAMGILTRTDIARGTRRRVVLVDHNEKAQSASGIEDASVVEIVDHHRVGDIETPGPIMFLNLPVGSTASIIAGRYEQLGIEMPQAIAGILLGALLTDTVILKSPTTTQSDRDLCDRLARRVGVEPVEFGMEIFRSRSAGTQLSAKAVVNTDIKEYHVGDVTVAIAQYETVETSEIMDRADEVRAEMGALLEARGYDLVILMVTDIVREGSIIMADGRVRLAEQSLGVSFAQGPVWMPGVLSRKKQIAAYLVEAASL